MDPTEPPSSEEERWKSVQPVPNWRKQTRQGLLSRHPAVGVVLVVVLASVAAFAVWGPLRSGDARSTLDRTARKGSESPLGPQLEAVTGFAASPPAGTDRALAGVETPDPATVVVRLDHPFSSFPAVLGHPGFGI